MKRGLVIADDFEGPGRFLGCAVGIHERVDDCCSAAFVYCRTSQAVPRLDVDAALADIGRTDYEEQLPMERFLSP